MEGFNEKDCVAFIRRSVGSEISSKYSDDEILYVADIIWDYYEKEGMLSLNDLDMDDELLDPDDLVAYVKSQLKNISEDVVEEADIPKIVKAELEYEESLEDIL